MNTKSHAGAQPSAGFNPDYTSMGNTIKLLLAGIVVSCFLCSFSSKEVLIKVSPHSGPSLHEAHAAVCSLLKADKAGEGIVVELQEGTYFIEEPLRFDVRYSATKHNPVTYRAAEGSKVIVSGGRQIKGWQPYEAGVWVVDLPRLEAGSWDFRQLYVNGGWRRRSRLPNQGAFQVQGLAGILPPEGEWRVASDRFEYAEGDLDPRWKDLGSAEITVLHYWTDTHLPVKGFEAGNILVTAAKSKKAFNDGFHGDNARYIIENFYEAMDQPGEWFLDTKAARLFYRPFGDENMNNAEVIAPLRNRLIVMEGNPGEGQFIDYIHFEGIDFRHANFVLPPEKCNDGQGSSEVDACIVLKGVRHSSFKACSLMHIGTFAFEIGEGCSFNTFSHNTIQEVAAGGFRIKGSPYGAPPLARTGSNAYTDNTIACYGLNYPSAVGFLLMNSDDNDISHNLIHHGSYTGISVGWSWGYAPSASYLNRIENNYIHHIGTDSLLSDMGAIYTLGLSPGTVIRGNLIHDVSAVRYGGWGIYLDEGSSGILVENNIVYRTKFSPFNIHFSRDIVVRNNIFAMGRLAMLSRSRVEPHVSLYFENNIIYWKDPACKLFAGDWSDMDYLFYTNVKVNPKEKSTTFVSDWNLFYNPQLTLPEVLCNEKSWEDWQSLNHDRNSIWADPCFVDVENDTYTLTPHSIALSRGFIPIETEGVGPRR